VSAISVQYVYHKVNMPSTYILMLFFQSLLLESRLITSCYVMYHLTMIICLFIIQEKQKQNKRNIKSRKINKKKRKMFKSKYTIKIFNICQAQFTSGVKVCKVDSEMYRLCETILASAYMLHHLSTM